MIKATYSITKVTRKGKADLYIGKLWNELSILAVTTRTSLSYENARFDLGEIAKKKNVELSFFDGEFEVEAPEGMTIVDGVFG